MTNLAFVTVQNNVLLTATPDVTFTLHGNVALQNVSGKPDPVVSINGTDSYIQLTGGSSCISNIDLCTTGFTIGIDVNFIHLLDNTFIVSSGGHLTGYKGIALYYVQNHLIYVVSTSTFIWTLIVPYQPVLNVWQHFEITWNRHIGIELLLNGVSLGNNGQPAPSSATHVASICIGCSQGFNSVSVNMLVTGVLSWNIDRIELVNAGLKPRKLFL